MSWPHWGGGDEKQRGMEKTTMPLPLEKKSAIIHFAQTFFRENSPQDSQPLYLSTCPLVLAKINML
jgi:hypothetical protein